VDLSGSSIVLKVGGVTLDTLSDSFNSTATKHGLYGYESDAAFEDFTAPTAVFPV
jgi:hypothetical protein